MKLSDLEHDVVHRSTKKLQDEAVAQFCLSAHDQQAVLQILFVAHMTVVFTVLYVGLINGGAQKILKDCHAYVAVQSTVDNQ